MKIYDVQCQTQDCSYVQSQLVEVKDVKATGGAFCALKGDGTVVTWGTWAKFRFLELGVGEGFKLFQMIFSQRSSHDGTTDGTSLPTFFRV